jgi:hypothetical protein
VSRSTRFRTLLPLISCALLVSAVQFVPTGAVGASSAQKVLKGSERIRHIWNIVLENEDCSSTFGSPASDPYLAKTLPSKGALLESYYATGHESNDNYISLVSGQPPNPQNQSDCQLYDDFAGVGDVRGIESGTGCVYPSDIATIGNQLTTEHESWKAYEQDMGNVPTREAAACGHPVLNGSDRTQKAVAGDGYATRHDPFVYFHSVIDTSAYCDEHVVALGSADGTMPASALKGETGLVSDLRHTSTTPAYSFITPNLCADGHDYPCVNTTGGSSALADIDTFLSTWIPKITASPAYREGGLIEITFDESDGAQADSSACCGEVAGPASPLPGISGPGGGKVGAVLLSPYIKAGTVTTRSYNHYSTLATDEELLGLPLLGEARTVTSTFGADVFTNP